MRSSVGQQALASPLAIAARLARIDEPHVKPLNDMVRAYVASRADGAEIPWFDPDDGGTGARLLMLLEAPGPKAVGTGFVSADNPDPTARNMRVLTQESGLRRCDVIRWNIVPWFPRADGAGSTFRAPTAGERQEGAIMLRDIIRLCPSLECVVTLGNQARDGWQLVVASTAPARALKHLHTWHPSARGLNGTGRRDQAVQTLRSAHSSP